MKYTGMRRKLDKAGRITLPIEIRKMCHFTSDSQIRMKIEGNKVHITRHPMTCDITGDVSDENLVVAGGQSPEGAKYVMEQLRTYIGESNN
ncbi:AbrB family transcriptional regulator [Bacillus thuringiensis]|uniref:AbrB family transcriptional regulator n=2 Tax=Bacillus thuringiensis TaxID=1428 RepID=A0A9X7BUM0_BACTU|nr:AbrB family transcriptional regulator [Bacillus thuringiensis]